MYMIFQLVIKILLANFKKLSCDLFSTERKRKLGNFRCFQSISENFQYFFWQQDLIEFLQQTSKVLSLVLQSPWKGGSKYRFLSFFFFTIFGIFGAVHFGTSLYLRTMSFKLKVSPIYLLSHMQKIFHDNKPSANKQLIINTLQTRFSQICPLVWPL